MRRIWDWIDERWPVKAITRWSLEEEITGGSSYWYTFGSSALFLFVLQAVTGVWQMLYYVPTVDHAYDSVIYIRTQVPLGWLIHGLHYWGNNAFIVLIGIHMARVFIWGAYKSPRQLTWLMGACLLLLALSMTFTGALLPWDELGYWAAEVGTSIAGTVPLIGDFIQRIARAGPSMEQLALVRFFVAHVALFGGALALFIGLHLIAFRQFGSVGPWAPERRRRTGWFWPDQFFKDMFVVSLLMFVLIGLTVFWPAPISGPADPADTSYLPKPEWNFLFLYQALKAFKGHWEPVGTVGIPLVLAALLFLLPFYDRREERNPARRRFAMAALVVAAAGWLALTIVGYYSKPGAASAATPHVTSIPRAPGAAPLSAGARAGERLFLDVGCIGCHTVNGKGGNVGPNLSGEGLRGRTRAWITVQIRDSKAHYPDSPMPAFTQLTDRQVNHLIDFLLSLKAKVTPTTGVPAQQAAPSGQTHGAPSATSGAAASSAQQLPASGEQGPPGPAAEIVGNPSLGGILFQQTCEACHGPRGIDKVPNPGSDDGTVPPLNPIDPELANKDAAVFARNIDRFIQHGSRPDGPDPKIHMPDFGATNTLTQQQISNIEAYILSLNGVDRAQIRHPGIPPRLVFIISIVVFGVSWLALGAWWAAVRGRRTQPAVPEQ
jgi:ubiquinol-cytochrome c reductase cytochrome b subunit